MIGMFFNFGIFLLIARSLKQYPYQTGCDYIERINIFLNINKISYLGIGDDQEIRQAGKE
jgi:hypothetical protein